jgi:hypothetical protein
MVVSEWGILGLILWIGFHSATFVMATRIKARAQVGDFYYWRGFALQLSLIAVWVASVFADRLYGEAPYWLAGIVYALYRIQHTEHAENSELATATETITTLPPGIPQSDRASSAA